jgi:hypothetical protein
MSVILSQIYCIVNQYLTQYVNTGNRIIDNHVIVLVPLFLASIVEFILLVWNQKVAQYIWYRFIKPVQYGFDATAVLYRTFKIDPQSDYKLSFKFKDILLDTNFAETVCLYINKFFPMQNEIAIEKNQYNVISIDKKKGNNFVNKIGDVIVSPVWFSKKHKEYVFIWQGKQDQTWRSGSIYMISNCKQALDEFCEFIKNYQENETNINSNEGLGIYKFECQRLVRYGSLNPKKTFDQIFFDEKHNTVELLKRFQKGQLYPAHFGMDNKLGILLHGPPGTGKTSFITCVANYLQRNIALVNLNNIQSQSEFNKLLEVKRFENFIFVFEELDCIPEVVRIRDGTVNMDTKSKVTQIEQNYFQIIANAKDSSQQTALFDKMKNEIHEVKSSINLSFLLQKLDGIESANGRLIIATTNHPEFIDPALLRPGRFDLKINLGKCSIKMLQQILSYYFQQDVPEESIPTSFDNQFAPVDVINACMICKQYQHVLDKLSIQ